MPCLYVLSLRLVRSADREDEHPSTGARRGRTAYLQDLAATRRGVTKMKRNRGGGGGGGG